MVLAFLDTIQHDLLVCAACNVRNAFIPRNISNPKVCWVWQTSLKV